MAQGAKQTNVTIRDLAATLAEKHAIPKKQAGEFLSGTLDLLTKHLKRGDRIRLAGFGILTVRQHAARMGRNPATDEPSRSRHTGRSRSGPRRSSGKRYTSIIWPASTSKASSLEAESLCVVSRIGADQDQAAFEGKLRRTAEAKPEKRAQSD